MMFNFNLRFGWKMKFECYQRQFHFIYYIFFHKWGIPTICCIFMPLVFNDNDNNIDTTSLAVDRCEPSNAPEVAILEMDERLNEHNHRLVINWINIFIIFCANASSVDCLYFGAFLFSRKERKGKWICMSTDWNERWIDLVQNGIIWLTHENILVSNVPCLRKWRIPLGCNIRIDSLPSYTRPGRLHAQQEQQQKVKSLSDMKMGFCVYRLQQCSVRRTGLWCVQTRYFSHMDEISDRESLHASRID